MKLSFLYIKKTNAINLILFKLMNICIYFIYTKYNILFLITHEYFVTKNSLHIYKI